MLPTEDGLYKKYGLREDEIAAVRGLVDDCRRREGVHVRINWDTLAARDSSRSSDLFYACDGRWVGYLGLFQYTASEVEASGLVDPAYQRRGIFTRLWEVAVTQCALRAAQRILLVCDRASAAGGGFARHVGAGVAFTEYRMRLDPARAAPPPEAPRLRLRPAAGADLRELAEQNALYFGGGVEEQLEILRDMLGQPDSTTYAAWLDGRIVGKVDLRANAQEGWVYGLGIRPEYRGQGLGRELLARAVALLRERRPAAILLEVEARNERALSLYQSAGFVQERTYDYWERRL
ncbi:MAG: GNAT family N-acetyltransferase [Chloroflexi bacterium]|nr:GNAT family N-acetyltransferase [Chloroflexota bacterium]